jgi:hypothetical protein
MGKYQQSKPSLLNRRTKGFQKKKYLKMKANIGFPYNLVDAMEGEK